MHLLLQQPQVQDWQSMCASTGAAKKNSTPAFRVAAWTLLLLLLAGCGSWVAVKEGPHAVAWKLPPSFLHTAHSFTSYAAPAWQQTQSWSAAVATSSIDLTSQAYSFSKQQAAQHWPEIQAKGSAAAKTAGRQLAEVRSVAANKVRDVSGFLWEWSPKLRGSFGGGWSDRALAPEMDESQAQFRVRLVIASVACQRPACINQVYTSSLGIWWSHCLMCIPTNSMFLPNSAARGKKCARNSIQG